MVLISEIGTKTKFSRYAVAKISNKFVWRRCAGGVGATSFCKVMQELVLFPKMKDRITDAFQSLHVLRPLGDSLKAIPCT